MVVGAFPASKLGFLLVRTLSKPIANKCKERAKQSPFFRKYICLPPAYFYNWCEVKAKMWVLNLGQPVQVPPLNEAMAIELGANLLGEIILFVIASAILIIEYSRQSIKQAAKDKESEEEKVELHLTIQNLSLQVETQQAQLRELFRHVYDLDTRVVKLPWIISQQQQEEEEILKKKLEAQNAPIVTKALSYVVKEALGFHRESYNT